MSNRIFSMLKFAVALIGMLALPLTAAAQTATSPTPSVSAPSVAPEAPAPSTMVTGDVAQGQPEPAVAEGADPALPHDLSPVGMFLAADYVVKGVMMALALASVATWAILLVKVFELSAAKTRLRQALFQFSEATGLRDASEGRPVRTGPAVDMLTAAGQELSKSEPILDLVPGEGVRERVASRLQRIEAGAGKKIAAGTGVLATVGSISPFVGLFGTVWGIMNSFIGISQAQTTNLAIVAPGIAEALLATAIGLVAAIPAVVIYNYFARSIAGYRLILADTAAAVDRLVSRDLDFRLARRVAPRFSDANRQGDLPAARGR
ncbi:biopolymer transport protein ExbB [Rhizobium sp. Leaf384]|uniref:tonB-system energizer ExbB n=1 Tax=unclassified Rhizobium TaxID=2613769 RepID=UPI000712A325|nr:MULTISPECIES: tonB-system energizer ExbB [unclassified Rhizobium]KQR67918.1 biopolymer transport protein ExbB [Rhizobium sp. Leaf341]KQS74437.1 biopolymer transport protein ExbB [Rhizobium sp. Leaf383]KQS80174.1 biopolymer transport protein ExbB [Rhizobium sp. Leaf384]